MKAPEKSPDPPTYLTTAEVAERLGRTPKTIRKWLDRAFFPNAFRPPGGQWSIPESDVVAFVERMKAGR